MYIPDNIKLTLKEKPVEHVAELLGLRVHRHQCLCFMHDDHHPSLVFNVRSNTWQCYVCGVYGDTISLVQRKMALNFSDACLWLASQYDINFDSAQDVPNVSPTTVVPKTQRSCKKERKDIDIEVLEFILENCNHKSAIAENFLFKEREYKKEVVEGMNIAFLPAHNGIAKCIVGKFGEERALQSGLIYKWHEEYSLFFNAPSLLFPYFDMEGKLKSVQARYVGKDDKPRFQFPRGSKALIFNLPVLNEIRDGDELYVSEGVTDCIALMSDGHKAIAVPSATLLKKEDLSLLAKYSLKMYPDQDMPGEKLFFDLKEGVEQYGGSLQRCILPEGKKDYSDFYKSNLHINDENDEKSEDHNYLRQNGKYMELIINTFGTSLNRDNEAFVISTAGRKQRIPVDGIRSIQVGRGVQVTSDAIMLAIDNEIEISFNDKAGQPVGRVWSPKYGSISTIRKGQMNFTFTHDALTWIKEVIIRKIENQQALIMMLVAEGDEERREVNKAISRLEDYRNKVKSLDGDIVSDVAPSLRGWEGQASKVYFDALNSFLPEDLRFATRSQKPAKDVVNAFLNYGYGMLYGRIEGALIKAGIDPYVGVLHRDDYNRPVLVYDVIELYRVWVDYVVYSIAVQGIITEEYYSVKEDGSYWLENLGRRVLIQSLNDYLEEVVGNENMQRSRLTQIQLYAHRLAQMFKNTL